MGKTLKAYYGGVFHLLRDILSRIFIARSTRGDFVVGFFPGVSESKPLAILYASYGGVSSLWLGEIWGV